MGFLSALNRIKYLQQYKSNLQKEYDYLEGVINKMENKKYDVVLSFAGEDRDYAKYVAEFLRENKVSVFYDDYEKAELLGKNLYEHLSKVYSSANDFCVIFISENYSEKVWTNHERRSAQVRALKEKEEYILPVRLDDTEIPGLLETVAYFDLRNNSIDELCRILLLKIKKKY